MTKDNMTPFGRGIKYEFKGTELHIVIDTEAEPKASSTGKTAIFATSRGNKPLGDFYIGINAYRYTDGGRGKPKKKSSKKKSKKAAKE
jgi:hypothetical protein